MKLKKHTESQNTENENQKLKEDTERMRMHYGMLLDHHIIDFDMFENKVGKENVPEILQEYNKILMKGELAEYEPDFIGICHHEKVNCPLQEPCPIGIKCNHEHEHSNAKMCYLNKQGGELETFLLKNNTSVPKLLEMEKTIAETKQETSETMKEKTTVFVVSSKFCGDFFVDAAFSTKQQAEDFITEREMSSASSTELTIDKPSQDVYELPFRPTPRHDERVNHPEHYQHPSGVECITIARHHDFNTGNALKHLFRAGLKQEQGFSPLDKQIEELQNAVIYIQDEIKLLKSKQ